MPLTIVPIRTRRDVRRFLMLPRSIYRGDPNWVSPLLRDIRASLDVPSLGRSNTQEAFLALAGTRPVGRVLAGIDPVLNARKGEQAGHLSLFECIDDDEVAGALFEAACSWLRAKNIVLVRGPVSPSGPAMDEYKGLLINGFERPPVVLTSYNPPYYQRLFEQHGFAKDLDVFAYYLDADRLFARNPDRALEYAARKHRWRLEMMNPKNPERDIRAIKQVLDVAVPAEWPDMIPPSLDEVRLMAARLMPLCDPELLIMAWSGDDPIGFGIAVPDYNQVLKHLHGRITPVGALKALWYRRRIRAIRFFILFVVPAFRSKGVSHAIYRRTFVRGIAKGYRWGEGSTIGETNLPMRHDIEGIGAERYKTYRVYRKAVT